MNEPFERCRVARLCEYPRRLDSTEWSERLELWQVAHDRVLLSVVQVLPDDLGTHEIWLSTEATSAVQLENVLLDWVRARSVSRETAAIASRRIATMLARWLPDLRGLPHTGDVDEAGASLMPTDRSAASR
jgi:hypothetical protein